MEVLRQQQMEHQAVISALNQFILQAGNIYKGKKLSRAETIRLEEAANQVGLSMEVVDALLEQTANPNAVVEYCMTADDAFARRVKQDPTLSRIFKRDGPFAGRDGLNLSNSVWRVFMHKIIQQFLRNHKMQIGDIMDKSSLTSRLYEDALKDDPVDSDDYENDFGIANIPRDFTEERKRVFISKDEAKKARLEAESKMGFHHSRTPFDDLMHRNSIQFLPRGDFPVDFRDDELSLIPCAMERERDNETQLDLSRRRSMPAPLSRPSPRKIRKSVGPGSAVRRRVAMFENLSDSQQSGSETKERIIRRKSEDHVISSKVSQWRALFEKGSTFSVGENGPIHGSAFRSGSDTSRQSRVSQQSANRLASFSPDPRMEDFRVNVSRQRQQMTKMNHPDKKTSKQNSSQLSSFSKQQLSGELSDTTVTSFSKQRKISHHQPGNFNTRALGLYDRESASESSSDQSRKIRPGHTHHSCSQSSRITKEGDEVVRYSSTNVFSKPDVICIEDNDSEMVQEVYSGLTQTSSNSDGRAETCVSSSERSQRNDSGRHGRRKMQESHCAKQGNRDEWSSFDNHNVFQSSSNVSDRPSRNRSPNGASSVQIEKKTRLQGHQEDHLPPSIQQEAWKKAFANRTKQDTAVKNASNKFTTANLENSPSLPKNYIHTFKNKPSMDEKHDWMEFDSSDFVQKKESIDARSQQKKQKKANPTKPQEMPTYSSGDNHSSKSKPRKYFQKLLRNEIRPPICFDDSDAIGSSSLTDSSANVQMKSSHIASFNTSSSSQPKRPHQNAEGRTRIVGKGQQSNSVYRDSWEDFRKNVNDEPLFQTKQETKNFNSSRHSYHIFKPSHNQEMAQLLSTGDDVIYARKDSNIVRKLVKKHEQRESESKASKEYSIESPQSTQRRAIHDTPASSKRRGGKTDNSKTRETQSRNSSQRSPRNSLREQGKKVPDTEADPIFQSLIPSRGSQDLHMQQSYISQQPSRSQNDIIRQSISSNIADVDALEQFRERRNSLEPVLPIQRGNVEMKKRMLEFNQAYGKDGERLNLFGSDNYKSLNVFLEGYDHQEMNKRYAPHRLNRTQESGTLQSQHHGMQQQSAYNDLQIKESSSSLSNLLKVDTASTDDDDVGLNSPSEVDWSNNRNERPIHSLRPSPPTAFCSDDVNNIDAIEADEAEIRAAAKQNGIPSPVIEILLRQSREANNRNPRVAQALTGIAKYDSDTGRPASARHLHHSPQQTLGFNTGRTWDAAEEAEEVKCEWPSTEAKELLQDSPCTRLAQEDIYDYSRPDPTPVAGSGAMSRWAMNSAQMEMRHMDAPSNQSVQFTEASGAPSRDELTLLNQFIEVSSGNFGGNKLSAESELRVRAAALKIGLTPKFVDQLLKQQQNLSDPFTCEVQNPQGIQPPQQTQKGYMGKLPHNPQMQGGPSPAPYIYGGDPYVGETSTYYSADMTRETRRTKKTEASDAGCNVWDTWEALRTNLGFALAKVCASNTNGDDESSISSRGSMEEKKRRRTSKRHRKSRQSIGLRRESNHYSEQERYSQEAPVQTSIDGGGQVGASTPQSIRGYV
jgi:hypothetical protein